mmetsp:Transcript_25781/g.63960  ORF Transcript_25781/g.63960 Transcript_25781/m.63960 type:complete len:109 (+) Transcript_25781:625-951(+)
MRQTRRQGKTGRIEFAWLCMRVCVRVCHHVMSCVVRRFCILTHWLDGWMAGCLHSCEHTERVWVLPCVRVTRRDERRSYEAVTDKFMGWCCLAVALAGCLAGSNEWGE